MPFKTQSWPLLLTCLMPFPAAAAPRSDPWFVHVGGARMMTNEAITAIILGSPLTGADLDIAAGSAAAVEIGHYVVPTLAVSISAGSPIRQRVGAAGSIRPYGTLGRVTYGPAALTAHWHPLPRSWFRPYVGGGVAYLHVFDTDADALAGFRLRDDVGPAVQGGVEVTAARHFGVFVDVKKAWLTSSAGGSLGPLPVNARVRLDPVILSAGAALRF